MGPVTVGCTLASVIGGGGWALGGVLGIGIEQILAALPAAIAARAIAAVQDGFVEFGILLVFIQGFYTAAL